METSNRHPLTDMLQLDRDIVFFDIESTGADAAHDKIVDLHCIRICKDGSVVHANFLLNPERQMTEEVIAIHGITNEMVADKPTFKESAQAILDIFENADYGGYNILGFDLPILNEELLRCGFELPRGLYFDMFNIFRKKEERTLTAAVKFYCGKDHEGAHGAQADTEATIDVFVSQLQKYEDLPKTSVELSKFTMMHDIVDFAGQFSKDKDGEYIYGKGKSKGTLVYKDPGYAQWLLRQSWPTRDTINWANTILEEIYRR